MKSMVSVIVPVYNAEKYLDRCLLSIVNQTYNCLQIILVDDSSTDRSGQMCDEWAKKDKRIKVLHKENGGAGYARNTGLEYIAGDFVCFVDSDDYLDVTTIEKCISKMELDHSDTAVFSSQNVYNDGKVEVESVDTRKTYFDEKAVKEELFPSLFTLSMGYGVGVWGKIFSADIIKRYNLRFLSEREIYSEDALFLLTYFSKCKSASAVAEHLYNYCENESSISRVYDKEKDEKLDIWLDKALEIAADENLSHKMIAHIQSRYQDCAMVGFKQVVLSDMSFSSKIKLLKEKYNNEKLKSTLNKEIVSLHGFAMRLFYFCVKNKLTILSYLLLWLRLHK